MDPQGAVDSLHTAQEAGSLISSHASPQGKSRAWGNTAFVILTPSHGLSSLDSPLGPLRRSPSLKALRLGASLIAEGC